MENENENFDELKQLLSLKKHEQPPPGYFNKLPGNVISRIRAERATELSAEAKLKSEAPWLVRFWQTLNAKPMFAGAVGAAACAVLLAGIFYAQSPGRRNQAATPLGVRPAQPIEMPVVAGTRTDLMLAETNLPGSGIDLFKLVQPENPLPASFSPGRTN